MVSVMKLSAVAVAASLVGTAFAADLTVTQPTTITESANYERGDIGADLTIDPSVKVSFSGNVQLASGVNVFLGEKARFLTANASGRFYNVVTNLGAGFFVASMGGTVFSKVTGHDEIPLWMEKMVLSPEATTDADTFDIMTLNGFSYADITCFQDENTTKPARYLFNGGLLRHHYKSSVGTPLTVSSSAKVIFEGVNGNDIIVVPTYSSSANFFAGDGEFETKGDCNFVIAACGETDPIPAAPCTKKDENVFGLATNTNVTINRSWFRIPSNGTWKWGHTGDLRLQAAAWLRLARENGLPYGPNTGIVRLYDWDHKPVDVGSEVPPRLDLNGYNACINGLVSDAGCEVTNFATAVTSTLTFGAEDVNGTLQAKISGNINVEKVGAGTLSISKTVLPQAFAAKAGTTVISSDMHIPEITLEAGAALTIDGATVTYDALHDSGATVTLLNGGRLVWLKSGAGERVVQAVDAPYSGDRAIRVQNGTLTFTGDRCTNEWWRLRVKKTDGTGGKWFEMGRIALRKTTTYDVNWTGMRMYSANFVNAQLTVVGEKDSDGMMSWYTTASQPADEAMARGTIKMSPGVKFSEDKTGSRKYYDLDIFTDIRTSYVSGLKGWEHTLCVDTSSCLVEDETTWLDFTMRLAEGKNEVRSWSTGATIWSAGILTDWELQSSPNGVDWETVQRGVGQNLRKTYMTDAGVTHSTWFAVNYGIPLDEGHLLGSKGFDPTIEFQVDAGATLDCSYMDEPQTLANLTIDAAVGAGTIKDVALASEGVLRIENAPRGRLSFPVNFVGSSGFENLPNWQVYINGKLVDRTAAWSGSSIDIEGKGLLMLLR